MYHAQPAPHTTYCKEETEEGFFDAILGLTTEPANLLSPSYFPDTLVLFISSRSSSFPRFLNSLTFASVLPVWK